MSRKKILVADLLCGAGGSSTGCERALLELGLEMELVCVNHWGVAIETHRRNHPDARHYVQDIATVRPHLIVPEGYLDLLMASPTCTHHSVARGGKPTSDQQRSDPWHIITWLTELRVKRIIIENVWEFTGWGPVDPKTGKPIKDRKGEYFFAWIETLRRLGFDPEWRKLNAANYGDATTRQRFILKARSDRRQVHWAPLTHAKKADGLELFPTVKPWRPAREIIDWNLKGRSIFNRKTPLAAKTLARIYAGAVKFQWPEPYLVILRNHMAAQGLDQPIPTLAANGQHIGLAQPVLFGNRTNNVAKTADEPAPTFTTAAGGGVGIAEPVVVRTAMPGRKSPGARGADDPLMTITTDGGIGFAEPIIGNLKKGTDARSPDDPLATPTTKPSLFTAEPIILSQHNSGAPRSAEEPLPTITTGGAGAEDHPGCARPILVEPFVAGMAHQGSDESRVKSPDDPLGTIHAGGGSFALVEPFVLSQASGGAPRSAEDPLPTIVAGGQRGSGTALISAYYSSGSGETCSSADDALPTITTKGRLGVVVPVTHSQGGNAARDVEDPLPTLTTAKGGELAVVMPVTHDDGSDRVRDTSEPLPTITGANRGELAFIAAAFGEREGQAPRTHSIDEPTPTVCATGLVRLVEGAEDGQGYDILFRMLEPHELAAAMGFNSEDQAYEFAGTKTEQIKQIGNAVSVAMMKAEVGAIMADAMPRRREKAVAARRDAA